MSVLAIQATLAEFGPSYAVPEGGGVITRFATSGLPAHAPNGQFRVVRQTTPFASVPFVLTDGAASVAARVPVRAGDRLAMSAVGGFCGHHGVEGDELGVAYDVADGNPFVQEGTEKSARLSMTADLERDADGDGFGDDTQDACATDAALQGICDADLTASQGVLEPTVPVGGVAIVSARVRNGSAGTAYGVRLAQALPPGVELIAATPSQGACAGADCTIGDLAPGEGALVVAGVRVTSAGAKALSATSSSVNVERAPQDNTAGATLTGIAPPVMAAPTPAPAPAPGPAALARTCRVPKLTGLSRSAATLVLEAATCRLGNATRQRQKRGTTRGTATVRQQSRKAGTEWPAGTRVNVVLAKKKKAARRRG